MTSPINLGLSPRMKAFPSFFYLSLGISTTSYICFTILLILPNQTFDSLILCFNLTILYIKFYLFIFLVVLHQPWLIYYSIYSRPSCIHNSFPHPFHGFPLLYVVFYFQVFRRETEEHRDKNK